MCPLHFLMVRIGGSLFLICSWLLWLSNHLNQKKQKGKCSLVLWNQLASGLVSSAWNGQKMVHAFSLSIIKAFNKERCPDDKDLQLAILISQGWGKPCLSLDPPPPLGVSDAKHRAPVLQTCGLGRASSDTSKNFRFEVQTCSWKTAIGASCPPAPQSYRCLVILQSRGVVQIKSYLTSTRRHYLLFASRVLSWLFSGQR